MKISTCLVLLTAGVYGVDVRVLHTTTGDHITVENGTLLVQENRDGWVNPEDLNSMPQCIAQQDQSAWLSTMTKCTTKRCTSHFGFICTHHQWLTQLSCLSLEFTPNVIDSYLPYCGRSILAKAQLYQWIQKITGRTWLVNVGDANELHKLSPASLAKGYATVDVTNNAPTCLTNSVSALSGEPFQHIIGSCTFTGTTQHTGNTARPWEYHESLRSVVSLDFETAGYDLARPGFRLWNGFAFGRGIADGDYLDKDCFCSTFTLNLETEPCSKSGQLDVTKERLWVSAICGAASMPENWTDGLKTTRSGYIPIADWHWPVDVSDMPNQAIKLADHCVTDACEVDSKGHCKVRRTIDKACFCRDISYDSCQGSCQVFETRIHYTKWLHSLCGNMQGWHGLPDNWRKLATPTPTEMIPWGWRIKPSIDSSISNITSPTATAACTSNERTLGGFAIVNIITFQVAFVIHLILRDSLWDSGWSSWFVKGTLIAALQLLANWFNALFVQKTPGYENVPILQLTLLWCTMPRLTWLTFLLVKKSAATSLLFAETILQLLSSYYMIMTVGYGIEHNFYTGGLEGAEAGGAANTMYIGALMWLIIASMIILPALIMRKMNSLNGPGNLYLPAQQRDKGSGTEHASLIRSERRDHAGYDTFPVKHQHQRAVQEALGQNEFAEFYALIAVGMLVLWVAQWLFWVGFIGISSEEFCPPNLGVLTTVWVVSWLAGTIIT